MWSRFPIKRIISVHEPPQDATAVAEFDLSDEQRRRVVVQERT
jgi:hypothetical protein